MDCIIWVYCLITIPDPPYYVNEWFDSFNASITQVYKPCILNILYIISVDVFRSIEVTSWGWEWAFNLNVWIWSKYALYKHSFKLLWQCIIQLLRKCICCRCAISVAYRLLHKNLLWANYFINCIYILVLD